MNGHDTSPPPERLRVGLVGFGQAGRALAKPLARNFALTIYDRDPQAYEALDRVEDAAVSIAGSPDALARDAEVVILSLPHPAASLDVANRIRASIGSGTTILETSTVAASDVEALQAAVAPAGARVVDAAIVGGVAKLAKGEGVFLVGSVEDAAGIAARVLDPLAEEIFYLGALGNGMRTKVALNAVAHAVFVVLIEAAGVAVLQGVPMKEFYRLLERESGLQRPLAHRFGERVFGGNFAGGMSTANARKDSALMLETARDLGVPLFAIQAAHAVYELAVREGLAGLDYAAIARLWERWLSISFRQNAP